MATHARFATSLEQHFAALAPAIRKESRRMTDEALEKLRALDDRELAAITLTHTWTSGMHDEVLRFLRRSDPLVASYLAMAILGCITMDHGQDAGLKFIEAVGAAAAAGPGNGDRQ